MTRLKKKNWQLENASPEIVELLQVELGVSKILARLLVNRNLKTVADAKQFFNADLSQMHNPFLLQDMQKSCERIALAITQGEKICVYGDYDVDGSVATALLVLFFRDIGQPISFYIPSRQKEGYSLNENALQTLKSQGFKLIITVDNGTMAHAAVEYANGIGLDVIITDHHKVGATLPKAFSVINPQRLDCDYPFKGICGAGVAFKLVMALRQHLRLAGFFTNQKEPPLKQYFDLLCLSTICDVVPLVDENRLIVKEGLKHLQHTKRPGLIALKEVCEIREVVTATDVGYKMGPRLNAAGRLDDASHGVRLLISENPFEARNFAVELNRLNLERRTIELDIVNEAVEMVLQMERIPAGLVVFAKHWHVGVIGIVASRLVEKFHRPTFVLCQNDSGEIKGSGRSFGAINLVKALQPCVPLLEKFGGHEAAAGVTLKDQNVEAFRLQFSEAIQEQTVEVLGMQKQWQVDMELPLQDLSFEILNEIDRLEPFGMGHAAPLFLAKNVVVASKKIVGEKHLKLSFKIKDNLIDGIAFQKADCFAELTPKLDVIYHLERNRFQGKVKLQLMIRDILQTAMDS